MIKRKLKTTKTTNEEKNRLEIVDSEDEDDAGSFDNNEEEDRTSIEVVKKKKAKFENQTHLSLAESIKSDSSAKQKFKYTNKQRVLIISSRGITARYRHLLEDLKKLIPHHKTDNKLDDKGDIQSINEIADLKSCNQVVYLETRKHQDLYMYIGRTPHGGPSAKFHVVNIHTMDELKLTGNCMLGSRPILNFSSAFNGPPHMQLLKSLLTDAFATPLCHPKSKPFSDRVMSFFALRNNIWVRNYQIVDKKEQPGGGSGGDESGKKRKKQSCGLVEIGPRFVLVPVRIFSGSLGGATLYANPSFVTPNSERAAAKKQQGGRYVARLEQKARRKEYAETELVVAPDQLSMAQVFKEPEGRAQQEDQDDDEEEE